MLIARESRGKTQFLLALSAKNVYCMIFECAEGYLSKGLFYKIGSVGDILYNRIEPSPN